MREAGGSGLAHHLLGAIRLGPLVKPHPFAERDLPVWGQGGSHRRARWHYRWRR